MMINVRRACVLIFVAVMVGLSACAHTLDDDIVPVTNFDAEQYLGTWYEIARLDNRFEKNLSHVTATYSRRDDNGIRVNNMGWNTQKNKWETAIGKAYFVETPDVGYLKVSFFGPFYAPYVVFDLKPDYSTAYVTNDDKSYLWLLAREPQIDPAVKADFIAKSTAMGFDVNALVWVKQDARPQPDAP